jgi:vitamin B12/bleomycin/antimicrobial peptide transport system ATP-binding/permease protein
VWCALAYAIVGSWLTWLVGRPLAPLNAQLRAKEADFRFTLVRANETSEGIALYRGEADEQRFIDGKLDALVAVMLRMANTYARLTWVTASYGWAAIVVPFIVTAPGYFSGTLTFGTLMMVAGAFTQVQQSLRWYVDNYANIAAWQAMSWRVLTYRNVLRRLETLGAGAGFAGRKHSSTDRFTVEDGFSVLAPSGRIAINEPGFSVGPGEHVLVTGPAGSGKSTYFRALAGLWPWGTGKAVLPPRDRVMFLPHFPYIPLGTLRYVLTYPAPGKFSDGAVRAALERLGLGHRASSLDEERRWDKELTLDEQQLVAFVRVLLHAPGLVIEDDAMSELDGDARQVLQSVFAKELANTALISIGREEFRDHFYQRRYHLSVRQPGIRLPLRLPD